MDAARRDEDWRGSAPWSADRAEAQEKYEYLQSLIHPMVAREILSTVLGRRRPHVLSVDGLMPEALVVECELHTSANVPIWRARRT